MMYEFTMPKVGMGDDETFGIVQWLVAEGASFEEGDPLLEVETSKASMEIEATETAVLAAQVCGEGATVEAGEVIAILAPAGHPIDDAELHARVEQLRSAISDDPSGGPDTYQSAAEPEPEVAAEQVPSPVESLPHPQPAPTRSGHTSMVQLPSMEFDRNTFAESGVLYGLPVRDRPRPVAFAAPVRTPGTDPVRRPLSRHRRALAQLMTTSNTIPQFSVHRELPMQQVSRTVEGLRARGVRATLTDVILRVTAMALVRHPEVNCTFSDDTILQYSAPAIALAADSPSGVVAPVVHGADSLSWELLADERHRLVTGARSGHLLPGDLSGGTFAISNVGALDGDAVIPMVMPPQVAILGLGRIRTGWGQTVATAVLTADHRVLDGADAARFLATLATLMDSIDADNTTRRENP